MLDNQTKQARAVDMLSVLRRHSNVEHTAAPPSRAQTLDPFLTKGTPPELITVVEDAVRRVLGQHGLTAFLMPREAAIAHEAGHAIVGTHEGLTIKRVTIFSRAVPFFGLCWGGLCEEAGDIWTSGPHSSAEADLRRARLTIAGLAAEALTGLDKPGSSLDELALSQLLGANAAMKLGHGDPRQLWSERVWRVALSILHGNHAPFAQIARQLDEKEKVQGGKLRRILSRVRA